jgi:hypothetical protein
VDVEVRSPRLRAPFEQSADRHAIVSLDEPLRGSAFFESRWRWRAIEGLGLASQLRGTALASPSQGRKLDH